LQKRIKLILILLIVVLTLSGCMRTVDQMYRVPKRSEQFTELQAVIDGSMTDLAYSAPISGENQQAVQMADLNGDSVEEYLLFAKGDFEHPLRILVFKQIGNSFELAQVIDSNGTDFDSVEYVDVDAKPGLELVFGSQLTDQLVRNVCVYTFTETLEAKLLISTNYTKYLCADLDGIEGRELFVIKPGSAETDKGVAELYWMNEGKVECSNTVELSGPSEKLKRVLLGRIEGGKPAIYVATTAADNAVITDVFICANESLINLTESNESGASVKTLRNSYVCADDIDGDGITELPYLMPMMPMENMETGNRQELIRWYSIDVSGKDVIKAYTFHDFVGGWYMDLNSQWAAQLTVVDLRGAYEFYIWDPEYVCAEKVMTVFTQSGHNHDSVNQSTEQIVLWNDDSVLFTAILEESAAQYGITPEWIISSFHMINQAWKTGET